MQCTKSLQQWYEETSYAQPKRLLPPLGHHYIPNLFRLGNRATEIYRSPGIYDYMVVSVDLVEWSERKERKQMFEKEIDELYEFTKRTINETKAHVQFEISNTACCIYIQDYAIYEHPKYDGVYTIYQQPILEKESREDYQKAKAHLLRLLGEK